MDASATELGLRQAHQRCVFPEPLEDQQTGKEQNGDTSTKDGHTIERNDAEPREQAPEQLPAVQLPQVAPFQYQEHHNCDAEDTSHDSDERPEEGVNNGV